MGNDDEKNKKNKGLSDVQIFWLVIIGLFVFLAIGKQFDSKKLNNFHDPAYRAATSRAVEAADLAAERAGVRLTDEQIKEISSEAFSNEAQRQRYQSQR